MNKPRIAISFSGGRTSAVMTKLLLEQCRDTHEIIVTFANTGCEHPATLDFVRDCDKHFGFGTVWLEAVVNPETGKGIRHRVVTYETASRAGEPFRDYIAKHGLPNASSPACTGRLKEDVMQSYVKAIGWKLKTFDWAIGIRADEIDRMSSKMGERRFIYPLVKAGYTKERVIQECRTWPFDLRLPGEHYGNCVWCWKKSNRKLFTVAKNNPEFFIFPAMMDMIYSKYRNREAGQSPQGDRRMFRQHRNTFDIIRLAREGNFEEFTDKNQLEFDPRYDVGSGCGESCEIGSDE